MMKPLTRTVFLLVTLFALTLGAPNASEAQQQNLVEQIDQDEKLHREKRRKLERQAELLKLQAEIAKDMSSIASAGMDPSGLLGDVGLPTGGILPAPMQNALPPELPEQEFVEPSVNLRLKAIVNGQAVFTVDESETYFKAGQTLPDGRKLVRVYQTSVVTESKGQKKREFLAW